jgi:anti-sigma regulatory factor (Ser/Thr protein kinase)
VQRLVGGVIETARSFRAHPASLHGVREFVREQATLAGVGPIAEDLVLAASEAAANAVMHSNTDVIKVRVRVHTDKAEVEVADRGVFKRRVPAAVDEGGRGIFMMMALMDEVGIRQGSPNEPGTVVTLRKRSDRQLARTSRSASA